MTGELFLKMALSYIAIFFGIYLLVKCMDLIEDYLNYRNKIQTLNRIEKKVDQLPGVNKEESNEYL
jgi:hypothetical protein